ncbi:MAG: ATP-dependent Clp protease ATP-binding subunit, partial [Odoribacter sp.]
MAKNDTNRLKEIMRLAGEEAMRLGNTKITPEHLFLGMLRQEHSQAVELLIALGVDFYEVRAKVEKKLGRKKDKKDEIPDELDFTLAANSILKRVVEEAWKLGDEEVESEHLMLALLRNQSNFVTKLINEMGVDYEEFKDEVLKEKLRMDSDEGEDSDELEGEEEEEPMYYRRKENNPLKSATPMLDNFGTDITKAAEAGTLDPIVGREQEIERLAQILSRRKKNNPILIGEPGVGKSAIAEGLAIRIVEKKVSRVLFGKRVVALDIASIVAGTKYRGQFEERMKAVLSELSKNRDIILFIDEIHTIVGAGGSGGSLDAANMLKPALSRGAIQCIGATTLDEYRKNIEKDGALERRFQKVLVEPTSLEETIEILNNIKERYEEHHNVHYSD